MTPAQVEAREQVKGLTLADVKRRLNTAADMFLALWAGDADAAKRSLFGMPVQAQVREMLCLAVDTVVSRRQRQLDYELDGFRVRRAHS